MVTHHCSYSIMKKASALLLGSIYRAFLYSLGTQTARRDDTQPFPCPLIHDEYSSRCLAQVNRGMIAIRAIRIPAVHKSGDGSTFLDEKIPHDRLALPPCQGLRRTGKLPDQCHTLMVACHRGFFKLIDSAIDVRHLALPVVKKCLTVQPGSAFPLEGKQTTGDLPTAAATPPSPAPTPYQ